jgi:hypothetical protein
MPWRTAVADREPLDPITDDGSPAAAFAIYQRIRPRDPKYACEFRKSGLRELMCSSIAGM